MRHYAILLMLGLVLAVAGCNTIHGMGEDIESAGDTIEEASD